MKLTENFYMHEFLRSRTAILRGLRMEPTEQVIESYRWGAVQILQPARDVLGVIVPSSGWRPRQLNKWVRGSKTSYHQSLKVGQGACDFITTKVSLRDAMQVFIDLDLPFRKLILEFEQWIHVSWDVSVKPMRKVYTAVMKEGKKVYLDGVV